MIITEKLSTQLLDTLACVAISAGETDLEEVMQYARNTYFTILDEWEEKKGESWIVRGE